MLSGIFNKKSDHPLADMRSVQKVLDELPKNDVHKVLLDIAEMIESAAGNASFKLDHQFAVLRLLDETAQPYVRKLTGEYFTPNELNQFQEARLWLVLGNLSRQTAIAYCTVFDRYVSAEKGSNTIKAQAPLLMARALNALTLQLKYICAHYELVDYAIWENLAHILSFAEQQQCLDAPVNLYSGIVGNTSVKCEAGRLLGWYGSGVHSLTPVHMHLTERIMAQYCLDVSVHAGQNESNLFSFDLSDPDAPKRVKVNAAVSPSTRFVSMPAMRPKLERLMMTLEKNIVPTDLHLGGSYGAELVKEAVRHLVTYLMGPPVRSSVRRKIKINFNVENSFAGVRDRVKEGLSFSNDRPVWTIEDISANGFLTVLPYKSGDDIRIGSVMGIQMEGVPHWGVAVVRRLLRNEMYQLNVGTEILATQVASVSLRQSGGGGGVFEDGQLALWFYAKPGEAPSGEVKLLMGAGAYSTNRSLQTQLNGKNYLLIPTGLHEKYIDCDLGRFRIVEQEHSSEESY
jgi:hypothetical protein